MLILLLLKIVISSSKSLNPWIKFFGRNVIVWLQFGKKFMIDF